MTGSSVVYLMKREEHADYNAIARMFSQIQVGDTGDEVKCSVLGRQINSLAELRGKTACHMSLVRLRECVMIRAPGVPIVSMAAPGVDIDSCQELLSYYPRSRQAPEIVRNIVNVIAQWHLALSKAVSGVRVIARSNTA